MGERFTFVPIMKKFGFGKAEKLKRRKLIEELFATGKNFSSFPIRMSYKFIPTDDSELFPLQAGVGVSRKRFHFLMQMALLLQQAFPQQWKTWLVLPPGSFGC